MEQRSDYFLRHVNNLAVAIQKRLEPEAELRREAFVMAQWAKQSAAATAIQQMGLRFAAGTDALAALVRERQDLSVFRQSREKLLVEALAKPDGQQNILRRLRGCAKNSPTLRASSLPTRHGWNGSSRIMRSSPTPSRSRSGTCSGCSVPMKRWSFS